MRCTTCRCILDESNCAPSQLIRKSAKCKSCTNAYSKAHYNRNREKYSKLSISRSRKYTVENIQKLLSYLEDKVCVDCGEADPLVLEFDHLRDKIYNVAVLWPKGHIWDKIEEEINKCEIVCANCHRRRTAKRGNWCKYKLIENKLL